MWGAPPAPLVTRRGGTKPTTPSVSPPHGFSPPRLKLGLRDKIPDFTSRVPLSWFSTKARIPSELRSLSRGRRKTVWGDTDGVGLGTTMPVTSDASGVRPHGASGPMVAWALGWVVIES
ncbi:hypothetical protein Sjap_014826 [Stephania japonica]|uniref:Uncharacterized protein n=1 Tax=Stephania japonica TaxID=461633 RepID=A0AAP0II10_9MAGN